jgi:hypothetical protein
MILNPLCAMSEIDFLDVRAKQLGAFMSFILTYIDQLTRLPDAHSGGRKSPT